MRTSDLGAEENIQGMEALITALSVNKHECRSEDVGTFYLFRPSTHFICCCFQTPSERGWMGHYLATGAVSNEVQIRV